MAAYIDNATRRQALTGAAAMAVTATISSAAAADDQGVIERLYREQMRREGVVNRSDTWAVAGIPDNDDDLVNSWMNAPHDAAVDLTPTTAADIVAMLLLAFSDNATNLTLGPIALDHAENFLAERAARPVGAAAG